MFSRLKYILIFGGTDLNHDQFDESRITLISEIVEGASHRICFTQNFLEIATSRWPQLKFILQPQAVSIPPNLKVENMVRRTVVLITGIRPVKDEVSEFSIIDRLNSPANFLTLKISEPCPDKKK